MFGLELLACRYPLGISDGALFCSEDDMQDCESVFLDPRISHKTSAVLDAPAARGIELPDDDRKALVAWVNECGEGAVAREIRVTRNAFARALGGLTLYRCTLKKVRAAIEARQSRSK